jgi:hypothetical protein
MTLWVKETNARSWRSSPLLKLALSVSARLIPRAFCSFGVSGKAILTLVLLGYCQGEDFAPTRRKSARERVLDSGQVAIQGNASISQCAKGVGEVVVL